MEEVQALEGHQWELADFSVVADLSADKTINKRKNDHYIYLILISFQFITNT